MESDDIVPVNIYMRKSMRDAAKELARADGRSMSSWIVRQVKEKLPKSQAKKIKDIPSQGRPTKEEKQ